MGGNVRACQSPAARSGIDDKKVVLASKLQRPCLRRAILRQRLMQKAEQTDDLRLLNICAGPGYGKTTLMAQIAQRFDGRSVWYQIDSFDRDPAVFLRHLITGITHSLGIRESRAMSRLGTINNVLKEDQSLMMVLIDEIFEYSSERLLICLDDFHLFSREDRVPQLVDLLIENLPDHIFLVITSRNIPVLSLGRLRSRGLLRDLREEDLQFSVDEIVELTDKWKLDVSSSAVHRVHKGTEGWAAGLVLMESYLQTGDEVPELSIDRQIQQNVYEYLAEEVLQKLPEDMQDFLTEVSLIDPVDPSICEQALRNKNSARILAEAEMQNLFTSRLSDSNLYKFHPLFREFLNDRLNQTSRNSTKGLRNKFAKAYESEGDIRSAVTQYLKADCYAAAIPLIEEIGDELLRCGESVVLREWIGAISEKRMTPTLKIYEGSGLLIDGKPLQALRIIEKARLQLPPAQSKTYYNSIITVAECYTELGLFQKGKDVLEPLLEQDLPEDVRTEILFVLGVCYWNGCNESLVCEFKETTMAAFDEISPSKEATKFDFLNIMKNLVQGDFPKACQQLRELAGLNVLSQRRQNIVQNNLASSLMMVAEYAEALSIAESCLRKITMQQERIRIPEIMDSYGCLLIAVGDKEEGRLMLEESLIEINKKESVDRTSSAFVNCHLGTYYRRNNNIEKALNFHKRSIAIAERKKEIYEIAIGYANIVADLIHNNVNEDIELFVSKARDFAVSHQLGYVLTHLDFHLAWHAHLKNDKEQELHHLAASLNRASEFQHNHFMIQEGKITLPLFATALQNEIETDYVCWLLEKIGDGSLPVFQSQLEHQNPRIRLKIASSLGKIGSVESLTLLRRMRYDSDEEVAGTVRSALKDIRNNLKTPFGILTQRETEVLKHISRGLTNSQIAANLFISERTVKTHVTKIFRKLGFTKRIDAALYYKQQRDTSDSI